MAIKRTRESEEMYLETILLLHKGQPNVRAVDVRDELGLAKSSVSRGVNLLEKKGYIHIDRETGNLVSPTQAEKKQRVFTSGIRRSQRRLQSSEQTPNLPKKTPAAWNTSSPTR